MRLGLYESGWDNLPLSLMICSVALLTITTLKCGHPNFKYLIQSYFFFKVVNSFHQFNVFFNLHHCNGWEHHLWPIAGHVAHDGLQQQWIWQRRRPWPNNHGRWYVEYLFSSIKIVENSKQSSQNGKKRFIRTVKDQSNFWKKSTFLTRAFSDLCNSLEQLKCQLQQIIEKWIYQFLACGVLQL